MPNQAVAGLYADIQRWMFNTALPWWTQNGLDRRDGGYVEAFTFGGSDSGADFKRTRVTCRQIYVFSHAATLGWEPGLEAASHGFDFLTRFAWMDGPRGFARRVTRTGDVKDPAPDLYDHAFALYAFGWFYRATREPKALEWAHRTLDSIEAHLRHPSGEGYLHEAPATGWRQQNPHMHLIEAALSVYEPSGDARFADLAKSIASLFQHRFFDAKSGTLAEFFAEDWSRAPGDPGRLIEPGHQFEWSWILQNCSRLLGLDLSAEIEGLVAFAERHGVDPATGVTYNSVKDDGAPLDRGSRTWPNTERLKAAVALWELKRTDPEPVFASSSRLLLDRYLATDIPGLWTDAFDAAGAPNAASVPTSTLYHVFLAFAEVLRVAEQRG